MEEDIIASTEGESPSFQLSTAVNWVAAAELLSGRRYEALSRVLAEAQAAAESAGETASSRVLAAAKQVSMACGQSQHEVGWHETAAQEAREREQELQHQLRDLLSLLGRAAATEPAGEVSGTIEADVPAADAEEPQSLWQRVRRLMARVPGGLGQPAEDQEPPTSIDPDMSEAPAEEAVVSPPEALAQDEEEEPGQQDLAKLVVYCLGPFRVYHHDELIRNWNGQKGLSIFKYLVVHRERPVPKDVLMDLFWRDAEPEAARRNLHQAIYSLRQTLRRSDPDFQHIEFENDCYFINSDLAIWVDVEEFKKRVREGRRHEVAARREDAIAAYSIAEGLYQGDFVADDPYEEWSMLQREHLRNEYLDVAGRLARYYIEERQHTAAISLSQKMLRHDNCHEEAYRYLMQSYAAQGLRHLALRQYQTCVKALDEELDLDPSEETVALYRELAGVENKST